MRTLIKYLSLGAGAWLLAGLPASAHDFWVEPSSFTAKIGDLLSVGLRVGDAGHGEPVARDERRIERFVYLGPSGEQDVLGRHGGKPAGQLRLAEPGLHVLAFRNTPSFVELAPGAFAHYLEEEGLDDVLAVRGDTDQPGRELYSRCAKSLVWVGEEPPQECNRIVGMPLELSLTTTPWSQQRPAEVHAQLTYLGQPLEGALVELLDLDHPVPHGKAPVARTDAEGTLKIPLSGSGRWMLAAVHMIPAEDAEVADWESFWASLTFEVQ